MIPSQYRMAVTVTVLDENDPDFPVGTKYFDASEWLKQPSYIKVSDFYFINTDFVPIKEPIGFEIISELYEKIQKAGYLPKFSSEKEDLDQEIAFYNLIEDKIIWEYVYSRFDDDTLEPNVDYFLIRFPYKEKWHEVLLRRKPYKESYSYMAMSSLYGDGEWYKQNDIMTYKEYLAKQAAEKRDKK